MGSASVIASTMSSGMRLPKWKEYYIWVNRISDVDSDSDCILTDQTIKLLFSKHAALLSGAFI
jgi:hypothetical protein